jgi:tRNA nucleotidyltransferase (CCA-adding enzyme)
MENPNLAAKIQKRLAPEALQQITKAAAIACGRGEKLFLAGGAVRDLLLNKPVLDIDLVVEGDAVAVAEELASNAGGKLNVYRPFHTATLGLQNISIDLATARSESYPQPGALPQVAPGRLSDDVKRRDFSINAMAASLNENDFGTLFDFCGGLADLKAGLIRVLHGKSFIDDATRVWRALRYEQRLGFRVEDETLLLLKHALPMLKTISGERIWYELECVLSESRPEKVLMRADELGVFKYLHPSLEADARLAGWFEKARRMNLPEKPSPDLYLALLIFDLNTDAVVKFSEYLKLEKHFVHVLQDSHKLKAGIEVLDKHPLQPSAIYLALHGYLESAVIANLIAVESLNVRRNIQHYLKALRYVKTELNGDDLVSLGLKPGPIIKLALDYLRDARLDGEVKTREDEERLLKREFLEKQEG